MSDLWSDLLGCVELSELVTTDRAFEGRNLDLEYHRILGGQILAQCVSAAQLSCPGKSVKSLHVLFTREGRAEEPVRYDVRRHQEGRTFASLSIVAGQSSGTIAIASVSLHGAEHGTARQSISPAPPVPGPEHAVELGMIPWETRSRDDLDARGARPPEFELWMRTPSTRADLASALTAYATDLTLIGTALRALDGVSQQDAGSAFTSAVTSHTIWFHRPFRTDDWLLLRQHSPILAHGRSFGRGDVLTGDGTLVASYAQEALLRLSGQS